MVKALKIEKDPENEIPVKLMEQSIVDIAKGFRYMQNSRLSKRAIILLVQHSVGSGFVTQKQVEAVLDAATNLDRDWLKK